MDQPARTALSPRLLIVQLCLLPMALGSFGPQEPGETAPAKTPRIASFALHKIGDANHDSVEDLLVVSRWGYVEDHGASPRNTSFTVLDAKTGEAIDRHDWDPEQESSFRVGATAAVELPGSSVGIVGFDHSVGPISGRNTYTYSMWSADGRTRQRTHTSAEDPKRRLRPLSVTPTGDFDGDGMVDLFVLAVSWDATVKKKPGVGYQWLDDMGFVHSGRDGRVLKRFLQPGEYGALFYGLSAAPDDYDVTGDGIPDLVVAGRIPMRHTPASSVVLVYSGDSSVAARILGPFPQETQFGRIDASRDLDRDGADDIAFTNTPLLSSADMSVVRVASGKSGELLLETRLPVKGECDTMFVDDIDRDRVADLFVLVREKESGLRGFSTGAAFHGFLLSGATGELLVERALTAGAGIATPTWAEPLVVDDVDGDGCEEIAVAFRRGTQKGPSAHSVAVLSGADLTTRYSRVLAGDPLLSEEEGPDRSKTDWRDRITVEGPLTPPSLDLVQSWPDFPVPGLQSPDAARSFENEFRKRLRGKPIEEASEREREEARSLQFVPQLMRALSNYYHSPPWTEVEVEWIDALSTLLSTLALEPELAVAGRSPDELRAGLERIKAWWEWGCTDNDFIADLVIFLNDGPFRGTTASHEDVSDLPSLGSVELASGGGQLELFAGDHPRRLYLEHTRADGSRSWCRRLTTGEGREAREPAGLKEGPVPLQAGFGWSVRGHVTWSGGHEAAVFHLDLEGNLRFYELSW